MRCVAGAGLLALVGCNQVFGIGATQGFDASVEMPTVVLDWQVATLPVAIPQVPIVQFVPISPRPAVRIAAFDVPFAATADQDADRTTYADDGTIEIPLRYLNTTWRLEYTLGGGVPHEVQWAPEDKQGHLTVPLFGRVDRDPIPTGSGYTVTPVAPAPVAFHHPRVYTTGIWTEGDAPASTTATIDYDFATAISQSGSRGRPDPNRGDHAVLVDLATAPDTMCQAAVGSTELTAVALQPAVHAAQAPTWDANLGSVMTSPQLGFEITSRLTSALGGLAPFDSKLDTSPMMFGALVTTQMPGLAATAESAKLAGAMLPVPVMQTLMQCPYSVPPTNLPGVAQPAALASSPRVLHVQVVDTRVALGVTLASGIETVIAAPPSTTTFSIAFPAPLPLQITLATPAAGALDLAGDADEIPVGAPGGVFTLAFTPETGTDLRADYFDVVLHRFGPAGLTTERIYTVTSPTVRIDGAVFAPGADYVFEIRTYKGHPRVVHGDFSAVEFPYGETIVFTRTIKTS